MSVLSLAWKGIWREAIAEARASLLTAFSDRCSPSHSLIIVVTRTRVRAHLVHPCREAATTSILGPTHGSALQVTLNTMFHIGDARRDDPVGRIREHPEGRARLVRGPIRGR